MDEDVRKKILIVDDAPVDRRILEEVLKSDYRITETGDPQGVLALVAENPPDLILLDILMPGMDGFEVCRKLKAHELYNSIPVIFFTSLTDTESKVKGFQSGAVDYITKPINPEEVRVRVQAHLLMTEKLKIADRQLKDFTVQMIQSEKMAAIGEITAGIAHELNQPLNVTKIICQSITKDIEKNRFDLESLKADLPEIIAQMNRMAKITDHIRSFAKYTPGKNKEDFNINSILENVFIFFGQQLMNHNIGVDKQYADDLGLVRGEPIALEQVFLNIITNARQAMEAAQKPEMKIEIKTYMTPDRQKVVAEFKDNGSGIPQEIREKIFESFFTTKEPGIGTGLGLSFAKKITQDHGGTIEVDSAVGEWTVFRVILPVVSSD